MGANTGVLGGVDVLEVTFFPKILSLADHRINAVAPLLYGHLHTGGNLHTTDSVRTWSQKSYNSY